MLSSGGMTKRLDRLYESLRSRRPTPLTAAAPGRLTRRGKTVIDKAVETHARNEEGLLASLTPADRRALDWLSRKLLAGLERPETPASVQSPRGL